MATSGITAGTVLGDALELVEPRAKTRAWIHWRGRHAAHGAVDVYLLTREALAFVDEVRAELEAPALPGAPGVVESGDERGRPWFAFAAPAGQSLAEWVEAACAGGGEPAYADVHDRMIRLLDALAALHGAELAHGALTPARVWLAERGDGVQLTEDVLGRLEARVAATVGAEGELPVYFAPEMCQDGAQPTSAADLWSFGALFATSLSGTTPTREALPFILDDLGSRYGDELAALLRGCLEPEELVRQHDLRALRRSLRDALVTVRMMGLSDEIVGPGAAATGPRASAPADPFAGLDLLPGAAGDAPRWLYSLGGVDYGPVGDAKILELLRADEIDEYTDVVDTRTQRTVRLMDVPEFTEAVRAWIPQREKMRAEREERRDRMVTEAKRTSRTTVFAGAFAVIALAAVAWFTRADAEALPLDALVLDFGFHVEAPQPDYQTIAADGDLLAALFNFEDPVPPPPPETPARRRVRRADGSALGDGLGGEAPMDDYVLSFDGSRPSSKLTSDQINGTVRSYVGSIRPCLEQEMRGNPGFRGVSVNWSIHPSGQTFNVNTSAMGSLSDDGERCIVRAFRSMRFPEFNDVPMSVSFPFTIQ